MPKPAAKPPDAVVSMVIAQALADAMGKGYQIVLVPGGDPTEWRNLAERAHYLLGFRNADHYDEHLQQWQADYSVTFDAYTLRKGVGAGDKAGGMGTAPVQPTPKPPGEPS